MKKSNVSPRMEKVLRLKVRYSGGKLLDVGCGNGEFAPLLKEAFGLGEAYGVDIAEQGVEEARSRGVNAVCSDLNNKLPFDDNYFDMVFAGEIIEHLVDSDMFLDELRRVLKPHGKCIITTPNIASWHDRISLLAGRQPYSILVSVRHREAGVFMAGIRGRRDGVLEFSKVDSGGGVVHVKFFTLGALRHLMRLHGFDIVKATGVPFEELSFQLPILVKKLLRLIDGIFACIPSLASGMMIHAVKVGDDE